MDPWQAEAGLTGSTWQQLLEAYLHSQTEATARAYRAALSAFRDFCKRSDGQALAPHEVRPAEVRAWMEYMRTMERKPATIAKRLAAVSSWYRFLMQPQGERGEQAHPSNPAAAVKRPRVQMYGRARKMSRATFKRILAIADPRTRAWLLYHALTSRRRSEVALVTWRRLQQRDGTWWYAFRGKGRVELEWAEMPRTVVDALQDWLGRPLEELVAERSPDHTIWDCSDDALARRYKAAVRSAGIDPDSVCVHSLRHLAAELRKEDQLRTKGVVDLAAIRDVLGHKSVATTEIYLKALEERRDDRADDIARDLLEDE